MRALGRTALVLTLVALTGCDRAEKAALAKAAATNAAAVQQAAPVTEGGVSVAVQAPAEAVELGGEILLKITVTNDSGEKMRVNVPRIDRSCATVRMRRKGGEPYVIERLHADVTERGLKWNVPVAKEIEAGDSVSADLSLTAMQVGEHHVTVQYRHSVTADPITAAPFTIEVKPAGEQEHLGVVLDTSFGALTLKLRPDVAPNTVQSFATLVRDGFFDGLKFHRIVAKFMAQGGDPKGDGSGGPGYFLPLEAQRDLLHKRGVLSMARTSIPDTAGSQFFLMFDRRPDLDPRGPGTGYTTFGEMIEGDDTLKKLEAVETKIADKIAEEIKRRNIPQEQVDMLVRSGRVEKSTPVEPVTIKSAKLIPLD